MAKKGLAPIDLMFPAKGLHEGQAFRAQPDGTAPDALNVRPLDAGKQRIRGGQRAGLSKWNDSRPGDGAVQGMLQVTVQDYYRLRYGTAPFSSVFTQADGLLSDTHFNLFQSTMPLNGSASADATDGPQVASNKVVATNSETYSHFYATVKDSLSLGTAYILKAKVRFDVPIPGTIDEECFVGFVFRAGAALTSQTYGVAGITIEHEGTAVKAVIYSGASSTKATLPIAHDNAFWATDHWLELHVNGDDMALYLDGFLQVVHSNAENSSNTGVGFLVSCDESEITLISLDDFLVNDAEAMTGGRRSYLLLAWGGGLYAMNELGVALLPDGANSVKAVGPVRMIQASATVSAVPGQYVFVVDGLYANYRIINALTGVVVSWTSLVTAGIMPRGTLDATLGCDAIALYRNRVVLYRLREDPHNWFMSKSGDPLDWDYTPATTTATQAVAGTNADAGKLGDVVTCCAAWSDDLLVMGGDHTLWVMRGDPAAGGAIDNLSLRAGIAGPDASAWDDVGNLYFFGSGAFWRMPAGAAAPEPLSGGRVDCSMGAIDLTTYRPVLCYDTALQAVSFFLVPLAQPATVPTHWLYDARTQSFWKDQLPAGVGPTCAVDFDSDDPDDHALLLAGWDGYIRKVDDASTTDDSTPIRSFVRFPTLVLAGEGLTATVVSLDAVLADDSGYSDLSVCVGRTAEAAAGSSSPVAERRMIGGRNPPMTQRVTAVAHSLMLERDGTVAGTWAMEVLRLTVVPGGPARSGRV